MFRFQKQLAELVAGQATILAALSELKAQGEKFMSAADNLTAAVSALTVAVQSAEAAIQTELNIIANDPATNAAIVSMTTRLFSESGIAGRIEEDTAS